MKAIDVYNNYKNKYKEYVILIKSGIFYGAFNDDVSIMYSLFNYKINKNGKNYVVGFPCKNISKVTDVLKQNKINYIVVDRFDDEYEIVDKYKVSKNTYDNYKVDIVKMNYLKYKIDNITNKLNSKIFDEDIEKLLLDIEGLL